MSGVGQAEKVLTKVNQRTGFLARTSKFLDRKAMMTLAGALVQQYFDYACCSRYSGLTSYLKNRLQTFQNKVVKVILNLPERTHLDPSHFENLGWLKVQQKVSQIELRIMHKIRLDKIRLCMVLSLLPEK